MAINPIDYSLSVAPLNPAQQIMQGMAVGQSLLDAREQGLQRQQAAQLRPIEMQAAQLGLRQGLAAEADANAARAMQQAMAQSAAVRSAQMQQAARALVSGQMTPDQVSRFAVEFPEHPINQKLKEVVEARTDVQRRQDFDQATQVVYALRSGNRDAAVSFLESSAQALEDAGAAEQAAGFRESVRQIRSGDAGANAVLGLTEASLAQLAPTLGKSLEDIQKAPANVRRAEAEASAAQVEADTKRQTLMAEIGLKKAQASKYYADIQRDKERLALDGKAYEANLAAKLAELEFKAQELPPGLVAPVLKMSQDSVASEMKADEWFKFAGEIKKFSGSVVPLATAVPGVVATGVTGRIAEAAKSALGAENAISTLRRRFDGLVASGVITNLPPGAASDKDIELIKSGFADKFSDPERLAEFAEAVGRVERATATVNAARAEFLSRNRSAGVARGDFTVGGVPVKAGETEAQVIRRAIDMAYLGDAKDAPTAEAVDTSPRRRGLTQGL